MLFFKVLYSTRLYIPAGGCWKVRICRGKISFKPIQSMAEPDNKIANKVARRRHWTTDLVDR